MSVEKINIPENKTLETNNLEINDNQEFIQERNKIALNSWIERLKLENEIMESKISSYYENLDQKDTIELNQIFYWYLC